MRLARIRIVAALAILLVAGLSRSTATAQTLLFVDEAALGANDGSSWANAFTELQPALTAARQSNAPPVEIWVAAGTYLPDGPGGDRVAGFELASGVSLYGGFVGGETRREQRNPVLNATILSGDLNGDDDSVFSGSSCCESRNASGCDDATCQTAVCLADSFCCDERWDQACADLTQCLCGDLCSTQCDNSFHVVVARDVGSTAILDGFIVTGGNANDGDTEDSHGGGLYISLSDPIIAHCVFLSNRAGGDGGGVYNDGAPMIVNCSFLGNTARRGGGFHSSGGSAMLVNCVFSGNAAINGGGGVSQSGQGLTLVNTTISGNFGNPGGGVRISGTTVTDITNTILWGNESNQTADEAAQIRFDVSSAVNLNYSCVQGLTGTLGGVGNIGENPAFVDPDGLDDQPGTLDDDVRLAPGSPAIDSGQNAVVPADFADLDGDDNRIERIPLDRDGQARFFDDPRVPNTGDGTSPIVDMGAYEVASDCNENGILDDKDVSSQTSPDCNDNNIPDECEIRVNSPATGGPFFCVFDCDRDCDDDGIPDDCQDDADADGVIDVCDVCPGTASGIPVDPEGCELPGACCFDVEVCFDDLLSGECGLIGGRFLGHELSCNADPDGDGAVGCDDGCPVDPSKTQPGLCGCNVPDVDADGDGTVDCLDPCPLDDPDDTDGDGVCDSDDPCPLDNPDDTDGDGVCQSDDPCPLDNPDDTDGDGTCDSDELCPNDPNKTEPGFCGCGTPDIDSDGDGVLDCFDDCPDTPTDTPVDSRGCPAQGACCFRVGDTEVCADQTLPQDCQLVGGTYQGNQSTCAEGCTFAGDFDGDGDIDAADVASFVACMDGPDLELAPGCERADFDANNRVDLRDAAVFQVAFTGAIP